MRSDISKRRFFSLLPAGLLGVVLFVSGCGTTELIKPSLENLAGDKPRTFLAGAEAQQAKSLAMGSAVSKGWKIIDAADNRLLIGRSLSIAAAGEMAVEPVTAPWIEVRTDFNARRGGVDVVTGAAMIATKVTKGKKSVIEIDVTDRYKDELNRSLDALRRSWGQNRRRIVTGVRPVPTKDVGSEDKDTGGMPGAIAGGKRDGNVAPVEERMRETGVWAYYARYYARIRGCKRVDRGTILDVETDAIFSSGATRAPAAS